LKGRARDHQPDPGERGRVAYCRCSKPKASQCISYYSLPGGYERDYSKVTLGLETVKLLIDKHGYLTGSLGKVLGIRQEQPRRWGCAFICFDKRHILEISKSLKMVEPLPVSKGLLVC
jgi:hypothetical protein